MTDKYELVHSDKPLYYRVKALKDFSDVKKGDLGGYVRNEVTLSQYGKSWVYDDAEIQGDCLIMEDAVVKGNALVSDSNIMGEAVIKDNAVVQNCTLLGDTLVEKKAEIIFSFVKGALTLTEDVKVSKLTYTQPVQQVLQNKKDVPGRFFYL